MASFRKRGKVWYYRYTDADGEKREKKGCRDRRVTEELARAAESKAAKIKAGECDPKVERIVREGRRPISEHMTEFAVSMQSKGDDPKHIQSTQHYIARVVTLAKIRYITDLTPSGIAEALTTLKADGLSHRAVNAHATAIKSLSRWLHRDGRTADYALAIVAKLDEKADRRYVRRPLTDAELWTLISTARTAPEWRGIVSVRDSQWGARGRATAPGF